MDNPWSGKTPASWRIMAPVTTLEGSLACRYSRLRVINARKPATPRKSADSPAAPLCREIGRLQPGAAVVAAHWRHPVAEYPLSGDAANAVIAATHGLKSLGSYRDRDVAIEVFDTGDGRSLATREGVSRSRLRSRLGPY